MGSFITPADMKTRALVPKILQMEDDELDELFIQPAEKLIEEACHLNLNTDGNPWRWQGRFDDSVDGPRLLAEYQAAYRLATIHLVNRLAANPLGQQVQAVAGASMTFGSAMPHQVRALMKKWSAPRRVFRT